MPKVTVRPNTPREFIGVDVGTVRVGLARGSDAARMAQPLKTVDVARAFEQLEEIISGYGAAGVVIGLPRGLDGQDTAQTRLVRNWARQAADIIKLPFYWQDEALTTQAARTHGSKEGVDAAAAAVILQDFLDTPEAEWVRC